jgi:hypothetical protein
MHVIARACLWAARSSRIHGNVEISKSRGAVEWIRGRVQLAVVESIAVLQSLRIYTGRAEVSRGSCVARAEDITAWKWQRCILILSTPGPNANPSPSSSPLGTHVFRLKKKAPSQTSPLQPRGQHARRASSWLFENIYFLASAPPSAFFASAAPSQLRHPMESLALPGPSPPPLARDRLHS